MPHTQRSLSLDENLRAKRGGKEKTAKTSLLLSSFTIPWSLALRYQSLAFRPRLCAKNEAPKEEAVSAACFRETAHLPLPCNPFFFYSLLQDSVVKIQARRELDHLALLDHLDQLDCLDHQAPKAHNKIFYLKNKIKISSIIKNKFFTNRNTVTPFPYPPLKKMKTKAKMCAKSTLLCIR